MSVQSTETARVRFLTVLACAALVSACGSSGVVESGGGSTRGEPVASAEPDSERSRSRATGGERVDDEAMPRPEVPEQALVSHERAVAALAAEDWFEAELELEQLTAAYPEFPGPYVNLAIVYRHDGRNDAARSMLEQAVAIAPAHPAANNLLGIMQRDAGEFEAAEASYRRVIESDPGYALAHYNLGVLLDLYMRRPADALAEYQAFQALQAEPDPQVGRWIVDLTRRVDAQAARLARESGQ